MRQSRYTAIGVVEVDRARCRCLERSGVAELGVGEVNLNDGVESALLNEDCVKVVAEVDPVGRHWGDSEAAGG